MNKLSIDEDNIISEVDLKELEEMLCGCRFPEIISLFKNKLIPIISQITNDYFVSAILSIYIFSLMKLQKYDQVNDTFNKFTKANNDSNNIFPLRFLYGKYYYLIVI
jgi:hypothetical protein